VVGDDAVSLRRVTGGIAEAL